jgi:hypothetical protein
MSLRFATSNQVATHRLKSTIRFLGYLTIHLVICFLFSVFIGWVEMQLFIHSKGPNYVNELVGMVVVIAMYVTGPISCLIASPLHLLVYLKKKDSNRHWFSVAASLSAAISVAAFFHILSGN